MNPTDLRRFWLAATLSIVLVAAPGCGQKEAPANRPPVEAKPAASVRRPAGSPVETFRQLLRMPPAEREQFLTNYPAEKREKILAKVDEYVMLPPDLLEMRLRATELRWYLIPLLKAPREQRAEQLKLIPDPYQDWIAARLEEWDIWPPDLKEEMLEYETTLHYFVGQDTTGKSVVQPQMVVEDVPEKERPMLECKLALWQALPAAQRDQIYASFKRYFDLSEDEQQKIMDALTEREREQAEKIVAPMGKRSKSEQERYLAAFRQFGELSPAELRTFMKNAERWQKMSEAERQAWRDVVQRLPNSPPLPPDFIPVAEPAGPGSSSARATNPAVVPKK